MRQMQEFRKAIVENDQHLFDKLLQEIIKKEINLNAKLEGLTALHLCCVFERDEMLKKLIKFGADINETAAIKTLDSLPPIHRNYHSRAADIGQIRLELVPLEFCIIYSSFVCAQILLEAGVKTITLNISHYFALRDGYDPSIDSKANDHRFPWLALLLAYDCHLDRTFIDFFIGNQANYHWPRTFLLGTHERKTDLFLAMKKLPEPARTHAMKKSLDEHTDIGQVFYYQNGFFPPSPQRESCTLFKINKEVNKNKDDKGCACVIS